MPEPKFKVDDRVQDRDPTGWGTANGGGPTLRRGTIREVRICVRYLVRWDKGTGHSGTLRGEDSIVQERSGVCHVGRSGWGKDIHFMVVFIVLRTPLDGILDEAFGG